MDPFIQVTTTTDKREDAERIARALVEGRLAACVQILGPLTSIYRWRGKIEVATEWLCLIKSRQALYEEVEAAIRALHPYETPEIVTQTITAGSSAYLNWLGSEVAGTEGPQDPPAGGMGK